MDATRRQLLKTLTLGAAGVAASACASHAPPQTEAISHHHINHWDGEADLLIVGSGAGAVSAAIDGQRLGLSTWMLEREHIAGGSSSISGGVCYLGGGTPLQKALGFDDSVESMLGYLIAASGAYADHAKLQLYCEQSLNHFDWLIDCGVHYAQKYSDEKELSIPDGSLYHCGSERAWPYREQFKPAPRGHVMASQHLTGGRELMRVLLARAAQLGARLTVNAEAQQLITASDGRIIGLRAHINGQAQTLRARRAVVLAAGGFIHNRAMLEQYAPELAACSTPWGRSGDVGIGIRMGMAAGAATRMMHHGFIVTPMYPPETILRGIAVNAQGQRFMTEDSYYGIVGHKIAFEQQGRAWMITDQNSAYQWKDDRLPIAARADTLAEIERALAMPEGFLQQTVHSYNQHAQNGADPLFHKAAAFIAPLNKPPFIAYDIGTKDAFTPAHTFGGLHTNTDAQVLDAWGEPIPGLYASGRTSAGIPVAPYVASGLSIGDGTFFGRRAAAHAATLQPITGA
ncbi:FAD-dependent oxidoreductase [Sinimarinibacterium sp. NLF-5-8]|uniref:FAD-dependent oxidoreductase n=1 Tax=Sinimarinibacterium sp. NLF-5-8 TaxID=2698684 RepID=UPI00137C3857|nr:FAD-dependent oxidoreductase [Sinimarinibacterium sp. NLF-5-8]QHS10341.1 FAD-dependent oxidoreductase [Sinimarinibacterium sp. NLF-5-8]